MADVASLLPGAKFSAKTDQWAVPLLVRVFGQFRAFGADFFDYQGVSDDDKIFASVLRGESVRPCRNGQNRDDQGPC